MGEKKSDVLQGTLDLMVLKTLHAMGPLHGFGIARRIEQLSEDVLQLNEGTVYTSLLRLQQQGWIKSEWGTSDNNRKARYYSITRLGKKQLDLETENWERIAGVIGRVLRARKAGIAPCDSFACGQQKSKFFSPGSVKTCSSRRRFNRTFRTSPSAISARECPAPTPSKRRDSSSAT